jgi:PTH1 family peptidyl-tRNA hydrolase
LKIVVGLGNPGRKYDNNRHNIGFWALDNLARQLGAEISQNKFNALFTKVNRGGEQIILIKPQTYMNLSGRPVREFRNFFKAVNSDIAVVYDDVDLDFGLVRLRPGGGAGGHNGIKSLIQELTGPDFFRIRCGVGPRGPGDLADFVLSNFPPHEMDPAMEMAQYAASASLSFCVDGGQKAMNMFNRPRDTDKTHKVPDAGDLAI